MSSLRIGRTLLTARQLISRPKYVTLFQYYRRLHASSILKSRPVRTAIKGDWSVRYLTCKDQILETLWAAKSLYRYIEAPLYFHEDGSFDSSSFELLREHFPDAHIISRKASDERTLPLLSKKCLDMRRKLIFFLRVFDFQVWAEEPYLQVDSDVLFFRRPIELLERQTGARFNSGRLSDFSGFAWEPAHINEKTGLKLKGGFNAGLLYFPHRVDFSRVEHWLDVLGEPTSLWSAEQTILNLEAVTMGMSPLGPQYDIYELNWPEVVSEHYLERSRLNMYRKAYPLLLPSMLERP